MTDFLNLAKASFSNTEQHLLGRFGCVGKNLAMMELRAATATLLQKYDVAFAQGTENGAAVLRDTKEQFTAIPGKLELVFSHRREHKSI